MQTLYRYNITQVLKKVQKLNHYVCVCGGGGHLTVTGLHLGMGNKVMEIVKERKRARDGKLEVE